MFVVSIFEFDLLEENIIDHQRINFVRVRDIIIRR